MAEIRLKRLNFRLLSQIKSIIKNFNLQEFSIKRFYKPGMKKFWNTVQGSQNTLKGREQATV